MPASSDHIQLSQLNEKIRQAIAGAFDTLNFWVIADITNHTFRPAKNYHHFELVEKDPDSNDIIAKISGSAWGSSSGKIAGFERTTGQKFTNNINVLVNVSVDFHKVYGLRLNLIDIDPNFTLGVLEMQKRATLERLATENPGFIERYGDRFLTKNNRLPFGKVIQNIALITSRTSAGAEDFLHTLQNNAHGYHFFIDEYFAGVQGESNAGALLAQIVAVFNTGKPYDAVAIIRGGGAQSDFLIFDNYMIGKAIAKFPIPIITGIGHQKNETIADLMAHTATKTPTQAAEFIIAHNRVFDEALTGFQKSIVIKSQQLLAKYKHNLVQINQVTINQSKSILFKNQNQLVQMAALILAKPRVILYNRINDIKNIVGNLRITARSYLKNQTGYLGHHDSIIKLMSPENVLKKGFAIIKRDGKITSDPANIKIGIEIQIILAETEITSTVNKKQTYDGRDFKL